MKEQLVKTQDQKTSEQFHLIKGQFSAEDAKEILMHMIQKKINFHEMKIFSNDIRFGQSDEASINRIEELRISKREVKALMEQAQAAGKSIKINSYTEIEII